MKKLHNLRCFIKYNPTATVSDYAKDIKDRRAQTIGEAYARYRETNTNN